MLTKTRIVAIFSLGLASALIMISFLLPNLISQDRPVPLDISHTTLSLRDPDAKIGPGYLGVEEKQPVTAPVVRQFNLEMGYPADEEVASVRVGVSTARQDVDDDLKALLDAQVWSYRVNRVSGEAVGSAKVADTPAVPPATVQMNGNWAKFPLNTQQQEYPYFDWTLREAVPARFDREETRSTADGQQARVYVFRQDIAPTDVTKKYRSIRGTITTPQGKRASLVHSGWREVSVEPQSGLIVGVEEDLHDFYRTADGKAVEDLLVFHGRTTESVENEMLAQATSMQAHRNVNGWSHGFLWGGVALLVVALIFALRPVSRAKARRERRGSDADAD